MPIYDFRCECGEVTEARAGYDVRTLPCPACGRQAKRVFAYADVLLIGETVAQSGRGTVTDKE
jgi:putative FmdB family regulatory protein